MLLLSDPVDEWLVSSLNEYKDKPRKSVAKGALDLEDLANPEDKKASEAKEKALAGLQKDKLIKFKKNNIIEINSN